MSMTAISMHPIVRIQHSSLLDKYRVRPSWRVAGVDYCVGYRPTNVLQDPAAASMAGVTVDKTRKIVTVTGNNVTLDSYDFSLGGGWGVSVRAANTSILNSKFVVGSNANPPIQGTTAASNLYVAYSTIDGSEIDVGNTGLIQMKGMNLTVRYCWVANSAGDSIQSHKGESWIFVTTSSSRVVWPPAHTATFSKSLVAHFRRPFFTTPPISTAAAMGAIRA